MRALFLLLVLTFTVPVLSKHICPCELPSKVITNFMKQYPNAKAWWNQDGYSYKASFKYNGKKMEVKMDTAGNFIQVLTKIKYHQLPESVKQYTEHNYKGGSSSGKAAIVEQGVRTMYEIKIKAAKSKQDSHILLEDNGGVVNVVMRKSPAD